MEGLEDRMELIRKDIHRNQLAGRTVSQITLDEDFIVPDTKEDVESLIMEQATLQVEDKHLAGNRLMIRGHLNFCTLYHVQSSNQLDNIEGSISFEEGVNLNEIREGDDLRVSAQTEDLNISLIHSRKINVRAVVTLTVTVNRIKDVELTVNTQEAQTVELATKYVEPLQLAVMTRDTYRVKEEAELSASKPNIADILWKQLELRGIECRPLDGKLSIHGEMELFCIYRGEEDHIPLQWLERSIPFSGAIEIPECRDEMIPDIHIRMTDTLVESKEDYDGEKRMLAVEGILELEICMYEETGIDMIQDMYCPGSDLELEEEQVMLPSLIVHNASKYKLTDKLTLNPEEKILQICHTEGEIFIEQAEPVEGGLQVEGTLAVSVLFVAADDNSPLRSTRGNLPFRYVVEAENMDPAALYTVEPRLEQLNAMALGSGEVEIKAVLVLDCLMTREQAVTNIRQAVQVPFDPEKIAGMPGIVGYVVQEGDTLWKIAKKFYVSVDSIRRWNEIGEEVSMGDRLILVKQVTK
jgi:hypothetical protein